MAASEKKHPAVKCFETFFKSCDFCFAVVGEDGCIIAANPGLGQLLGCDAEELTGRRFSELLATPAYAQTQTTEAALKYFFKEPVFMWSGGLGRHDGGTVEARFLSRCAASSGSVLVEIFPLNSSAAKIENAAAAVDDSFLENIFSTVGDGLYVTDELGYIIKANPALARMLGYGQQELIGLHFVEFTTRTADSGSGAVPELMEQLLSQGSIENYEAPWRKKDGSPVQVELNVRLLKNKVGAMIGAVSAVRDITRRKLSEAALRESERQFRTITDSTFDAIITINSSGLISFWNSGACRIFGYEADEVVGRPVAMLVPERLQQQDAFSMHQALQNGSSMLTGKTLEQTYRRKNGREFAGELSLAALHMCGEMAVSAVVRDISERKKVESAMRESEQRFRVLANSAPDAIIFLDSQGRIIFWNQGAQKMYGYDYKEMLGKTPEIIMPPDIFDGHEKFFAPANDSSADLGNLPFESFGLHKNGGRFPLEISLSSDRAGDDVFYCAVARDTTDRKRAEAELKEARDFLEEVFLATGDGILITNTTGHIVRVNAATARMLGASEKDLRGRPSSELVPADIKDSQYMKRAAAMRKSLFERGHTENFESAWQRSDGSVFPVEITSTLLNDTSGQFSGTISCVRDITERKKTEEALRESEERFRVLAESLPEGIIAIDSKGAIVFWNTGAQNLFGYTKEEVLGKPSTMLLPERYQLAEQESLRALQQPGLPGFNGRILHGFGRRKDGTEFADEISSGPWPTRQGLYYVAIIRDITERLKAEQALRDSEQRFKELADALPQTVFELNLEGMITFVNRTALDTFGHNQTDIDKGMHALHMIVPEQRITVRENIEKVFAGERLGGQEYIALRKDGTTFPCIIHASPILADGKPQGLRGLLIDITLRKELEEEMNKSKRLASISTLAGGVAQDFNTILSIILGNINLAQHQVAPEDRVSEHLSAAERATLRAKDLTGQLIAFARGGTALKTVVSVEKLLRDAADAALKGSNVACSFSFPPDLERTELDEAQMRQVFINLLINADQAMPEGGSIDVAAKNITVGPGDNLPLSNGAYVKITICDQSIGILNEHLQQLFDPYFTSRQRGSGIGLATIYTIIKNHGGLITVESEFGRGTTFHVFLPASTGKE